MLAENQIFAPFPEEQVLHNSRRHGGNAELTPDVIDYEMQFPHSDSVMMLHHLTQAGFEHFVSDYGQSYRVLYLNDCTEIQDFSPLGGLKKLEAVRLEWCRKTDKLWDMSGNDSLKILSICDAKKLVENPLQICTSSTLEEVRLWGAFFDNKYTLDSLECFRGMESLRRIDLNHIKLKNRNFDVLSTLPNLMEFHFDAGMLTTEEIAWVVAKYPHLSGTSLCAYHKVDAGVHDVRVCGFRKPGLDLPQHQKRLDRYVAEFNALVETYRNEV